MNPNQEITVEVSGNILTVKGFTFNQLGMYVNKWKVTQFSVIQSNDDDTNPLFDISYAMRPVEHSAHAGLIHRHNAEKKVDTKGGKPDNTPPNGPDGTPPKGGTQGSTRQVEFVNTTAIAA